MNRARFVLCLFVLAAILLATPQADTDARSDRRSPIEFTIEPPAPPLNFPALPPGFTPPMGAIEPGPAAVDTTELGSWDFDGLNDCDAQGWISADLTVQTGAYFHVDDFVGLGGGDTGRLAPLEGTQSLWCGARPDINNIYLCGYATLPGYGNNWDQSFGTSTCLNVSGNVVLDYLVSYDTEGFYDFAYVEYDVCDDQWVEITSYDGTGNATAADTLFDAAHDGSVRLRFRFTSDAVWSDEDGLWPSDGALIIDNVTVSDTSGVVLATELFETETVGDTATTSGNWGSQIAQGYGDFAGLFPGTTVLQNKGDCFPQNVSCLWGFFKGSLSPYNCGEVVWQPAIPYGNTRGQYIDNEVWSPLISWPGGDFAELQFDQYGDNPLNPLIFPIWRVRSIVDGCPQPWEYIDLALSNPVRGWETLHKPFGHLVEPGSSHIQIALGVKDFCFTWCGIFGDGKCHRHAPLYDNVRVYKLDVTSPQWTLRDIDMFQDNFAEDGTITGTARADMADDLLPSHVSNIRPGDSVVVTVRYPGGLATDAYSGTGPAVYCYVSVRPQNQPWKSGDALSGDLSRWPVVDSFTRGGDTWYCLQMDTVVSQFGTISKDKYCVDLNDNLFTPGDTVFFVFAAQAAAPSSKFSYATLGMTEYGQWIYQTDDLGRAIAYADEFTILPAGGYLRGGDILYVDGMNFRGAQMFFDLSFRSLALDGLVDRYDIRASASIFVGNHPGGRVKNVAQQIVACYQKIIWNTGNLQSVFADGTGGLDKSDDTGLLLQFMNTLPVAGGVYLSGDDVSEVWLNQLWGTSASQLRSKYMDFNLISGDHEPTTGVSPLVIGESGGMFDGILGPDTLLAYGGCPLPNDFDVIEPSSGLSVRQASYNGNGPNYGAIVTQVTNNDVGQNVGFMLSGFSFHQIYNDGIYRDVPARHEHMYKILHFLQNLVPLPHGVEPGGYVSELSQNYPNPFNPTTTISYSIAERGHVSLRVYNVAGQLVRTLVDDVRSPEGVRPVHWEGLNDRGQPVSSGIYFYKLVTRDFTQTRKMVLLK